MSAIRVSGRKNSGINIAGFNSQDGENAYYCNCYNCSCLLDSSKDKKILSGVIKNSGTSCSICRTKIVGWLNGVVWSASYFVSVRIVNQILC